MQRSVPWALRTGWRVAIEACELANASRLRQLGPMGVRHPTAGPTAVREWSGTAIMTLVLVATAIGVLDTIQAIAGLRARLPAAELPGVAQVVRNHFVPWWLWAALVPVIAVLVRRFPLDRARVRNVALHLGLGVVVVAGYQLVLATVASAAAADGLTLEGIGRALRGSLAWRFVLDYLTYWAIAGALHAVGYQRRIRKQELDAARHEAESARARLVSLEARLHPHFLFNTLNTVSALVREERPVEAIETIARLSDLLRRVLHHEPGTTIALDEELEMAYLYLDIVETRFGDRLTVRRKIAPDTLDARVPPFLLQPVLENAFRHGFDATAGPGVVTIVARRDGDDLVLAVRDTGPGFPPGAHAGAGVGLRITAERLNRMFGPRGTIRLGRAEQGGADVELRMPFRPARRDALETVEA